MSSTHLRPEHIGEPLVSALIRQLKDDQCLDRLKCRNILDGVESHFERVLRENEVGTDFTVHDNVSLASLKYENIEYAFDGMSQVDCVVYGNTSFGVEIKLGTTRMTATEFTRRFCSQCRFTNHVPRRVCGSMIAVLDGRFEQDDLKQVQLMAKVTEDVFVPLAKSWGLVVRRQVYSQWDKKAFPSVARPCWVIVFEDFIDAVGGADNFNKIVSRLVGDEFVTSWGLV